MSGVARARAAPPLVKAAFMGVSCHASPCPTPPKSTYTTSPHVHAHHLLPSVVHQPPIVRFEKQTRAPMRAQWLECSEGSRTGRRTTEPSVAVSLPPNARHRFAFLAHWGWICAHKIARTHRPIVQAKNIVIGRDHEACNLEVCSSGCKGERW